jgi:hypothetical protein
MATGSVRCCHPSRRIAEPVIGRAFARPVADAPQDEDGVGFTNPDAALSWGEKTERRPDGQITSRDFSPPLSIVFCKNILIFRNGKSVYMHCRPVPREGRFAIVTDAGRDAVDAKGR